MQKSRNIFIYLKQCGSFIRLGELFTCCCVDGNFRDAASLITHLCIVLSLEMALHTGPGVKTSGRTKAQVSINDTESTEESQSCPLIRVFPRLHTLSITRLPYNSAIKWH